MYSYLKKKINNYLNKDYNNMIFLIFGRAAIDLVIKDILAKKNLINAYLPRYLCDSMIVPFIDNNINIIFYDITYDENSFDIDTTEFCCAESSIVLYCDYFIENKSMYDKVVNNITSSSVLIHDTTHSLFSKKFDD